MKEKKLYGVTAHLLGRVKDNPLPPNVSDVTLANDFLRFFTEKIAKIRDELDNIEPAPLTALTAENTLQIPCFAEFKRLTTNEVSRLILDSKSTTCELDIHCHQEFFQVNGRLQISDLS